MRRRREKISISTYTLFQTKSSRKNAINSYLIFLPCNNSKNQSLDCYFPEAVKPAITPLILQTMTHWLVTLTTYLGALSKREINTYLKDGEVFKNAIHHVLFRQVL